VLIGWSRHSGTAGRADGPRALTDYMDATTVAKRLSNGRVQHVQRHPMPEILLGDASLLRMAIRSSTCLHRYSSCTLSFAMDDIDVDAFNGGEPEARFGADLALRLWVDTALAGIPTHARPPLYATTHTHTGALEINVAMPRWIMGPDGRQRGFNPAPPEKNHATWDAVRDVLNHRFGWADPDDPDRRRSVVQPDWMLKFDAESCRAGLALQPSARRQITDDVLAEVAAGIIRNRAGILDWLRRRCEETGWILYSVAAKSITMGPANAAPSARIRLKGVIFEDTFGQTLAQTPAQIYQQARDTRLDELLTAVPRLQAQLDRRAVFNRSRFGLGQWPPQPVSAVQYANAVPGDNPLSITRKHHLHAISKGPQPHDIETDPDGARLARHIGPDGYGSAGARQGIDRQDQRFDAAASATRNLCRRFAQLAEPVHAQAIFDQLTARIGRLAAALRTRLTLMRISVAIPDTLLHRLAEVHSALEAFNGTSRENPGNGQPDRTVVERADPAHPAPARLVGGQLRRDDTSPRRGDRCIGADRPRIAKDGESPERRTATAFPGPRPPAADDNAKSGSANADVGRPPRLVGRGAAPNSRAHLLRHLRLAAYEAEPTAPVGLQFSGEQGSWPPVLEINISRVGDQSACSIATEKPVCKMTCNLALIGKMAPALQQAIDEGWISGVDFNRMDVLEISGRSYIDPSPDPAKPNPDLTPSAGMLVQIEQKAHIPDEDPDPGYR
jgi:hypothetical protein